MSPPGSNTEYGGPYRKPRADLYTVLLILALIAIVLATVCLYFEMQMYEFKFKDFKGAPRARADHPLTPGVADGQWAAGSGQWAGTRNPGPLVSNHRMESTRLHFSLL